MDSNNKKQNTVFSTKEFFISYAVFAGIIMVLFGILVYTVLISRNAWNNNLKYSAEKVLEENEPGNWSVGSSMDIGNPMKMRSGCFGARNRQTGEMYYLFITRVPTFYGPMGAVFTCSLDGNVEFKGYSSVHGRILNQINQSKKDIRIKYIEERIPFIIGIEQDIE